MIPSRSPVAIRLGKLAEADRTGALYMSGESGGVIHLSEGAVLAADSPRTPGLAARIGQAGRTGQATQTGRAGQAGAVPGQELAGSFERSWMAAEATVDAALEMMSARPRHVRFRGPEEENGEKKGPSPGGADALSIATTWCPFSCGAAVIPRWRRSLSAPAR